MPSRADYNYRLDREKKGDVSQPSCVLGYKFSQEKVGNVVSSTKQKVLTFYNSNGVVHTFNYKSFNKANKKALKWKR